MSDNSPDLSKSGVAQPDPAVSSVASAQRQQEKEQVLKERAAENEDTAGDISLDDLLEVEEVDTDFYLVNKLDPRRLIPGSSRYLDDVERENAERTRALVEGREPDLENPPSTQGTPVMSQSVADHQGLSTAQVDPYATLPVVTQVGPTVHGEAAVEGNVVTSGTGPTKTE